MSSGGQGLGDLDDTAEGPKGVDQQVDAEPDRVVVQPSVRSARSAPKAVQAGQAVQAAAHTEASLSFEFQAAQMAKVLRLVPVLKFRA